MTKNKNHFKLLLIMILMIMIFPANTYAADAYKTYTLSIDGEEIKTQTAYEAVGILSNDQMIKPENVFIDQTNNIYVADSGSKEIIIFDQFGKFIKTIGKGILEKPVGISVDKDQKLFVADVAKETVYCFSLDGKLLAEYGKPDSPLFGKGQPFKPLKLSVDGRGNMYIIGEGAANGIIQLNKDGEFLGYFGANRASTSLFQTFKNYVMSKSGQRKGFMNVPIASTGIDIDQRGIVYTVTNGLESEAIKKLNVAGTNMLQNGVYSSNSAIDIVVGNQGNFYVLSSNGYVYEYDSTGNLLFKFGSKESNAQRQGIFKQPSSIGVDKKGNLYIADAEQGIIHIFEPTEFTNKLHEGLAYFEEGLYVKSQKYWQEVLQLNSSFSLAHIAMGQAYYKQQEYNHSLNEFELANNREGYSQSFWEIRHNLLEKHTGKALSFIILVIFIYYLVRYINRKKDYFHGIREKVNRFKNIKLVSELLLIFKLFRHPIDTFYEIKKLKKASFLSATIFYVLFFIEYLISLNFTGFIFNSELLERFSLFLIISIFFGALGLFVIMNYLISTINDGEGSFKNVYIGTIYSLAPYLVFSIPVTLLSRVITINESFLFTFSTQLMVGWSLLILFIMIKEIHNFTIGETIKNILLTLFSCVITVVVLFVLYILLNQVIDFVYSVIQEVMVRV
ncbi:YIP1 family protein [Bacillus sp. AL-1R]